LISLFPYISAYAAGDIPDNVDVPPIEGFHASTSVDSEPYEIVMVADSDDDRPVGKMTKSDVEMLRRVYSGRHDTRVHEFSDLTLSNQVCAEGRDDELREALKAGLEMTVEKGWVFKDLPALKRWLQVFAVIHKRPYKVLHSYVERCYTVVCDKPPCPWRVCARKQKVDEKWKITKVVGLHNCASHDLDTKHWQLTSTLIAKCCW
jgi:hypothetical protein